MTAVVCQRMHSRRFNVIRQRSFLTMDDLGQHLYKSLSEGLDMWWTSNRPQTSAECLHRMHVYVVLIAENRSILLVFQKAPAIVGDFLHCYHSLHCYHFSKLVHRYPSSIRISILRTPAAASLRPDCISCSACATGFTRCSRKSTTFSRNVSNCRICSRKYIELFPPLLQFVSCVVYIHGLIRAASR